MSLITDRWWNHQQLSVKTITTEGTRIYYRCHHKIISGFFCRRVTVRSRSTSLRLIIRFSGSSLNIRKRKGIIYERRSLPWQRTSTLNCLYVLYDCLGGLSVVTKRWITIILEKYSLTHQNRSDEFVVWLFKTLCRSKISSYIFLIVRKINQRRDLQNRIYTDNT